MNSATRRELQLLARQMLRARNIELGDDPRTEIEVARELGILILEAELAENIQEQDNGIL